MKDFISQRIQKAIHEKVFPGCTVGWIKDGIQDTLAFGNFTYEPNSPIVHRDTLYDVASITKVIPSACILLKLVEDKKIRLGDPVVVYVPEFGNYEEKKSVTIEHLLTYTLDLVLPSTGTITGKTAEELMNIVLRAPLRHPPGSTYLYTNSTAGISGLVIERVTGKTLDVIAREYFFEPLAMTRSVFYPLRLFSKGEIAPTEIDVSRGGLLQGVVHDESSFVLEKRSATAIAGLFSTAPDMVTFMNMIVGGGTKNGTRYFSEDMILRMGTNQLSSIGACAGLGWEMCQPDYMGAFTSPYMIGQRGYTGCVVIMDIRRNIAMTLLSNRVYPKRPTDGVAINSVRRDIADIIFRPE